MNGGQDIDAPDVPGATILWRYIHERDVKRDRPDGPVVRVSSAAFKTQRMSAYVISETSEAALRAKFPHAYCFRAFTAQVARNVGCNVGCIVVRKPDQWDDHSHVEICDANQPDKKLGSKAEKMLEQSTCAIHGPAIGASC